MPRHYRINQETGFMEYDDSSPRIYGNCPKCGKLHDGAFHKCDDCIQEELDEYHESLEQQELHDMYEDEKYSNEDE